MLRRAIAAAAVSVVLLSAAPAVAHAGGSGHGGHHGSDSYRSDQSHRFTGYGSRGSWTSSRDRGDDSSSFVEVRWATPLSSGASRPSGGNDKRIWPQTLATAETCGVWLQLDRYKPGSTTDRLIEGGVLYAPNNPTEVHASSFPYAETGQPWTYVKAPDCSTATPRPTPTPRPTRTPCPTPSATTPVTPTPTPTPTPDVTPTPTPTPTEPVVPPVTPTPEPTTPATPVATPTPTTPADEEAAPTPTPTPTVPGDEQVLPEPPTATPDEPLGEEVLAATGASGGAIALLAGGTLIAGAGALVLATRGRRKAEGR